MEPQILVEKLKKRPETYLTILGSKTNQTEIFKLKRKLRWYIKNNIINSGKTIKHNTIFYSPKKEYFIFMFEKNKKITIIYSKKMDVLSSKKIHFEKFYELKNSKWIMQKNKTFRAEELRKWI